jgi:hypothetical protein
MSNHACLSIGIDRYQSFPALEYAAADARAVAEFFRENAAWKQEKCLLLTDDSPTANGRSTYPTRENIGEWLRDWVWDSLQPGDVFWFFFSGYSAIEDGVEYLIPLDAQPNDLVKTGISLYSLYRQLGALGVDALVFLDIKRDRNPRQSHAVTIDLPELAREFNVVTFLSCQNDEFSHDAPSLGQGLFAASLLEALRYHHDLTIQSLSEYLQERIPELAEHHWRPPQHPVTIVPEGVSPYRSLFSATTQTSIAANIPHASLEDAGDPSGNISDPGGALVIRRRESYTKPINWLSIGSIASGVGIVAVTMGLQSRLPPQKIFPRVEPTIRASLSAATPTVTSSISPTPAATPTVTPSISPTPAVAEGSTDAKELLSRAKKGIRRDDAKSHAEAISLLRQVPKSDPKYAAIQQEIRLLAKEIYFISRRQATKRNYADAIASAKLVPNDSPRYRSAQQDIARWQKKIN